MSSQSDIYGPGYVNMLPLFSMYISCNYHFLQRFPLEIHRGKKLLGECHQQSVIVRALLRYNSRRKTDSSPGKIFYLYLTSTYKNHQCLVTTYLPLRLKLTATQSKALSILWYIYVHAPDDLQVWKNLNAAYLQQATYVSICQTS